MTPVNSMISSLTQGEPLTEDSGNTSRSGRETIELGSHARFAKSLTYYFHNIDLRESTKELFSRFHKDCVQRKIRRSERENLKYEEGTSDDLLFKFYGLLVQTRRRHCLPPQPLRWFKSLVACFGKQVKIRIASQNGMPIASIITLSQNRTITYKYGCSDARFHKLGGMALLFWRTIQEAKAEGFDELDLGRSEPDNAGLVAFKESWGASKTELAYWVYPGKIRAHPGKWQRRLVQSVVSVLPDVALKTVGRLWLSTHRVNETSPPIMIFNRAYYFFKPLIPKSLRLALRRSRAKYKQMTCANIWPIDKRAGAAPPGWPGWPQGKRFALVLTHDVESGRGLASIEQLMKLELKHGFRSSFNLVPEGDYQDSGRNAIYARQKWV